MVVASQTVSFPRPVLLQKILQICRH